jgi:hypothetical protein
MRKQVMTVADSEHWKASRQDGALHRRACIVVNAVRSAGDNDSRRVAYFLKRYVARENVGRNPEFPDFACDQVAVLTAGIENGNLGVMLLCVGEQIVVWASESYFRILSTMILCALLRSAWAFGMASMACMTSGSVLISYLRLSSTLNAVL